MREAFQIAVHLKVFVANVKLYLFLGFSLYRYRRRRERTPECLFLFRLTLYYLRCMIIRPLIISIHNKSTEIPPFFSGLET